jgi:hypothetical protein
MSLDFTKMPIAQSLGFTATQATNQLKKNAKALQWAVRDLSDLTIAQRKAIYTQVFNMLTDEEPQNCGTPYDIGRRLGIPSQWVEKIVAEIIAGAKDLDSKGEL